MNVKLNEHYMFLFSRPLPVAVVVDFRYTWHTLTLNTKIHKSSQRTHALKMSKNAKRQKGETLKRMHFMFDVHVFSVCDSIFHVQNFLCELFTFRVFYSLSKIYTYKCMQRSDTKT